MTRYQDDDRDDPADADMDADSADEGTVACPNCGREIYETAEQCPKCRQYVSCEEHASRFLPRWVVVTAIVLIAASVLSLLLLH